MDGFPVTINSPRLQFSVIKWILDILVSFAPVTLLGLGADTVYEVGTVLGKIILGAASVAAPVAQGTNSAGNGVYSALSVAAGTKIGNWVHQFLDATHIEVVDPDGDVVGHAVAGAAYAGVGPHFTFTAGGTAQVVGDQFTLAVTYAAGSGKYVQLDPAAVDGSQNFGAVLGERVFIPDGVDVDAQGLVADGIVLADALIWKAGMTDDQIAAVLAQAAKVRISTKVSS